MLTDVTKRKIEDIRESVFAMIDDRTASTVADVFRPSDFWTHINRYLEYVRFLPAEQLENIRCHVGMGYFLGPPWHAEFYQGFQATDDESASELPLVKKYLSYTSGLPERYWASEPATNDAVAAIGISYKGRRISADVVKEQATIRNLFNLGLIGAANKDELTILEVGPGYAPLIFQLSGMLATSSRFVCVDQPETLFWAGVFLAVNTDPADLYIWRPTDEDSVESLMRRYRFVLLPSHVLPALGNRRIFDLAINKNSFQEMTEDQVRMYAETISNVLNGWIYSYNASRQFMNAQLHTTVDAVLAEYFDGGPTTEEYRQAGVEFRDVEAKRIFVGTSKSISAPPIPEKRSNALWLADKAVEIA